MGCASSEKATSLRLQGVSVAAHFFLASHYRPKLIPFLDWRPLDCVVRFLFS
jgi:hypothetical protein